MSSSPETPKKNQDRASVEQLVQLYGDLLFDLCDSVLAERASAQVAFRSIIKELRKGSREESYSAHQRAWVLRIAVNRLKMLPSRHRPRVSTAEQIRLDANENVSARLKHFDSYFHRLNSEDQLLFLLRDKYGLPYPEIATAMGIPEASLRVRRQQALRTLEEWLWESS